MGWRHRDTGGGVHRSPMRMEKTANPQHRTVAGGARKHGSGWHPGHGGRELNGSGNRWPRWRLGGWSPRRGPRRRWLRRIAHAINGDAIPRIPVFPKVRKVNDGNRMPTTGPKTNKTNP